MVRVKLSRLKPNKSSGPDQISTNMLRECLGFDVPLAILFNKSLQANQVPQDWRDSNVVPLHKKGSRTRCGNYRQVSLTSQVVKLMERIVQDHIFNLTRINKTFSCHQHGFQNQCSCVTQLLECLNDWTDNIDSELETDVIYLDFAKAFDTVPHRRLLFKLRKAGIRGKVLNWIESFLDKRRQKVVLRNGSSSWGDVSSGVPQGSILGPILFLLYVNDLPEAVSTTAKMFADDTKVYESVTSREDCNRLQSDLNSLSAWSRTWLLQFNASKCVVLKIRQSLNYSYTLNGLILQSVTSQRDLGVIISKTLSPSTHIQNSVKKANQRIGMVRHCFTDLTEIKVKKLYIAIIRPVLEYGSPVWNPWLKKDINMLEKVQERCLRLSKESISLPSLATRRDQQDMCEVYKYLNNNYKTESGLFFNKPERKIRGHSQKLFKPYARTNTRKYFFSHRVVDKWNNLPEEAVSAPSLTSFKKIPRSLSHGTEG
jgi:hypothetical protein